MQGRKTHSFRLTDASVFFTPKKLLLNQDQSSNSISFSTSAPSEVNSSWVTILIGRNGIGKSRFLASIAETFSQLEDPIKSSSRSRAEVNLKYSTAGATVDIRSLNGKFKILVDGAAVQDLHKVPLPSKVIALTTTPFDKFKISNWKRDSVFGATSNCYEYLGLRDRSGKASAIAPLLKAIEGLFNISHGRIKRLDRVAGAFSFLGFKPEIEVVYRASHKRIEELASDNIQLVMESFESQAAINDMKLAIDYDAMASAAKLFIESSSSRNHISIRADFDTHVNDINLYSQLEPLRKTRVITPVEVIVTRQDGLKVDLQSASSGEMSLVTAFLGLASVIEDGSLILIDEPEVSLHPEWQSGYIDLLLKTFSDYKGCHFIIATHSPLIVGDIDANISNVVVMERNYSSDIEPIDISGKSSDHILATAFQTPGKNNLYLKQEIIKALRLAANGEVKSEEFQTTVEWLVSLLPKLEEEASVSKVIMNLQEVATEAEAAE
ncbi:MULTISPECIES: AAA family ATPase [unclassified Pseudomonas]|uniref:AAA family ATPase n=1 Tax=unclassified Pseudomonas TaxID=196821 RepID=UPI0013025D9A|nr:MULTISPECIES: AAA family ATPase [unclassified Pseudomonas]